MQGPGMGAAALAAGVDDDISRRICPDRRATAERNIARSAAAGTAWRGRDST